MIQEIKNRAFKEIEAVDNEKLLEQVRIKYLGRKGELTQILRGLKDLAIEERRKIGPQAQQLKKELEEKLNEKQKQLLTFNFQLSTKIDITKPGKKISMGHIHPLSKIEDEIRQIFLSMNFSAVEGPEVENEHYNFDALNIPPDHPARDIWDTFWLKEVKCDTRQGNGKQKNMSHSVYRSLLRTHTSPMQIRYMETHNPPFQIIVPGRVFRYEATDASHEINFYQIEGLMVGKDVSLANFKFVIEEFFKKFFGKSAGRRIEFRYRPSYFPFVEPGIEVDIKFKNKWLEIMGAGMVNRKVFEAVKYNPYEWQGFAFGMSLERLTMIKYNIPDIRLFYSGDLRFIQQF